jgi:TolA-binding protein
MARRQLKNYAPAIEDLDALLAADPTPEEKSRARHVLGLCQKGLDQFDAAAATFQKLLQDDPKYADAENVYFDLGWTLKSAKKEAEAAQTFAKLVERFPDSPLVPDCHYMVGDFAFAEKDYNRAAVSYHAAMTKAGNTKLGEEAVYKLGLAYYLLDDWKDAQQTFNYLRLTWPQGSLRGDAAYMEGECLAKLKRFEEALGVYELAKDPSNKDVAALAVLHAAEAAAQLKQWEKSLTLATQCISQFPESASLPQALYAKGWAQQNLGKLDEALATYAEVVAKSNEEPAARALFMTGEILFQQKKYDQAIVNFFKVSYGYGYPQWQADATYEAARCFEVRGQKAQALKQYQTLVEKYPASDKVSLAKERIAALK